MRHKESYSIYPVKAAEHISLLKYSKSSCGVDFLLNTAESSEKPGWFNIDKRYKTDFIRTDGYIADTIKKQRNQLKTRTEEQAVY